MIYTRQLPRSGPESQGIPSSAILAFLDSLAASGLGMHSVMLLRHGHVVAEGWWAPYAAEIKHLLNSISKSFTATAAGLAMAEGYFSLDDPVVGFFPDERPNEVSENLASMRIRHLLTMTAGHDGEGWTLAAMNDLFAAPDRDWARAFLARPVVHEPGAHFAYCSASGYMVSAIIQKTTGHTLLDYLRPRLLDPLGIAEAEWWSCPRGVNMGGIGLSLTTESVAKFGQLYLQDGVWEGKRIMPEGWVVEATARLVPNGDDPGNDWQQGYGYQFWRCRHNAYRGDGANGQFCVVMPDQDAVLVATAGHTDMPGFLNLVWEHLLPAMGDARLTDDPTTQAKLARVLGGLALAAPEGADASPLAANVSGRTYAFPANEVELETIACAFDEGDAVVTLRNGRGDHAFVCGWTKWRDGTTKLLRDADVRVLSRGAWSDDSTYVAKLVFVETELNLTLTCRFDEGKLFFGLHANVSHWGPQGLQLEARPCEDG